MPQKPNSERDKMTEETIKERKIYSGFNEGLYKQSHFEEFVENLDGVITILYMDRRIFPVAGVYLFSSKNVILKYEYKFDLSHPTAGARTSITLFGNEEGIGEVEKLVLERAEERQNLSMMTSG